MIKRIFSVILAVSLALTSLCVWAEDKAAESVKNENASELFEWLGIVFSKSDEQHQAEITRADFVVYTARALGIDDTIDPGETRYFVDMAMYDYASYSVNCLVEKGILSVGENKMFRPAEPITYNEAVKIAVCALGYKPVAETKGGYPNGYLFTAKQLGLLNEVSAVQKFTLNDAVTLLYEALRTPLYVVNSVTIEADGSITGYRASEEDLLFYESFGYKYQKGILTGYDGMNTSFGVVASDERAVVDNVLYKVAEDVDLTEFLGRTVCILVDRNGFIVFAYCEPKGDEITEIDVRDYAGYSGGNITYNYQNKANRSIDVSSATILYNGAIPERDTTTLLNSLESGSVTVIDSDGNGVNDVVVVKDYHAFVVKSVNLNKNIIYSKIQGQKEIDLENYDKLMICDKDGGEIALTELENGDMLNVLAAADKSRIKIIVTDDEVSGTVEQTWDGNIFRFKVGGGIYNVNKTYSGIKSQIKPGMTATFLLNMFGEAVFVTEGLRENYQVGFLIGLRVDGTFDTALQMRIYTKNGGIAVFETIEKLRVDGKRQAGATAAVNSIPDAACDESGIKAFKSQLILFKTNADGKITDIDTYNPSDVENPELTLARVADGENAIEKMEGRLGKTLPVNQTTDFYCVPQENALAHDIENYKVVKQGSFNRTVKFKFECYKLKGKNEFVDAVIYHMNPADTSENSWLNSNMFLVGEKVTSLDKEGNTFTTISGLMQGGKSSIDVFEERLLETSARLADINEGDLIRFRKGETGRVIEIQKLYDARLNQKISWSGDTEAASLFDTAYNSNFQLSFGYVSKKGEETVSWGYKSGAQADEIMGLSSAKCMICDSSLSDGSRLYIGTIDDIVDDETAPGKGDIIIVQMKQTTVQSVVVYKR